MYKSVLLVSSLCLAAVASAEKSVFIQNNDATSWNTLYVPDGNRYCFCLSQTQTASIRGNLGGNVKLFARSDCTGNYADGSGKTTYNAQWVNSISFGDSGVPSTWDGGSWCNWYK